MTFSPAFYRTAAVCSMLSAVTTLLLIALPGLHGVGPSIEARVALLDDPRYVLRAWAYLLHPFLVLGAAMGVAAALRMTAAGAALAGLLGFALWAFTEAAQQTLTLTAFHRWAAAYPTAEESVRMVLRIQIETFYVIWDAMFLLLLLAFLAGNVLFGLAMWPQRGLTRLVGGCFFAAAILTAFGISSELGGPVVPSPVDAWLYPLIQPAARTIIGIWLWRRASAPP
jgi:hypothetical protein